MHIILMPFFIMIAFLVGAYINLTAKTIEAGQEQLKINQSFVKKCLKESDITIKGHEYSENDFRKIIRDSKPIDLTFENVKKLCGTKKYNEILSFKIDNCIQEDDIVIKDDSLSRYEKIIRGEDIYEISKYGHYILRTPLCKEQIEN